MKDEIKEIIDRLERIDHKEYIAFEFADSATFDEMARCFEERKKMADYIKKLQEEIERLKKELFSKPDNEITLKTTDGQTMTIIQSERIDMQEKLNKSLEEMYKKYNDYKSRNEKAIEHLKEVMKDEEEYEEDYIYNKYLLDILQGSDKE